MQCNLGDGNARVWRSSFCFNFWTKIVKTRQSDISSHDHAKDAVRHAEDQITMKTHKDHSMNTREKFSPATLYIILCKMLKK